MYSALDKQKSAEQDEQADEDLKDVHVLVKKVVILTMLNLDVAVLGPDCRAGLVSNG